MEQAALALYEFGLLGAYYTTVGFSEQGPMIHAAKALDRVLGTSVASELRRRGIKEFPCGLLHTYPWWEVPRTVISRSNLNDGLAESLLNRSLAGFDRHVARDVQRFSAVYAYNGAARTTFAAARAKGVFTIYCVSDLAPSFYSRIRAEDYDKYPNLVTPDQKRIDDATNARATSLAEEWDLADLVVMHSDFCRETYDALGMDMSKAQVVPLGFPDVLSEDVSRAEKGDPLRVLWAGTFTAMKGSHYLLDALKTIPRTVSLHVDVYGKLMLPRAMLENLDHLIRLRPSIPRDALFQVYRRADILVLPTLSDTFGMVISEAMSQGLPVITTPRAGASQFIRSGENGLLIPAADTGALADALCWCARHREELRLMRAKARETALNWQWRDFRHALGSVVHRALQQRRVPNP